MEPEIIEQTRRMLGDHKDAKGYSENELAKTISTRTGRPISAGAVGNFIRNKYGADESQIARLFALYLEDEVQRLSEIGEGLAFVKTTPAREIERAVLIAEKTGLFAIAALAAGMGKTRIVNELRAERNSIYISYSDDLNGPWPLGMQIVYSLTLDTVKRALPTREIARMLIRRNSPTIFIDEAQKIDDKRIDFLRCIADQSGCPLVLVGNSKVYERADSSIAAHAQYTSRVVARVHITSEQLKEQDVRLVAQQIVKKKAVDASIELLLAAGRREGTLRTVKAILDVAKINFATDDPSFKQIIDAIEYVKGVGSVRRRGVAL